MTEGAGVGKAARVPPFQLLDAFRGFAAVWVVMLHACQPVILGPYPHLADNPFFRFSLLGALGVTMFFVISGYCIASAAVSVRSKPDPLRGYVRARVRRIYPPYYAASLLMVAASLLATYLQARGVIGGSSLATLDLPHQGPRYWVALLTLMQMPLRTGMLIVIYWSLCYEVAFYLVVLLALAAAPRRARPGVMLHGLNALTLACLAWRAAAPASCGYPFDLWPMFGLGVLVFHARLEPGSKAPRVLFAAAAVLAAAGAVRDWGVGGVGHPPAGLGWCFGLGFAALLFVLYPRDERLSRLAPLRFLAWVGVFSYSLYLTHIPVLGVLNQVGRRLGVSASWFWVQELGAVAACIAFARLFFPLCERPFVGNLPAPRVEAAPTRPAGATR